MRREVLLGESEAVSGIVVVFGLATYVAVSWLTWRALRTTLPSPPRAWLLLPLLAGYLATIPFAVARQGFGRSLLSVIGSRLSFVDSTVYFYRYGSFWFPRKFATATIATITERRLSDADAAGSPTWALVVEFSDGTSAEFGKFQNAQIHELVAELNAIVRAAKAGV